MVKTDCIDLLQMATEALPVMCVAAGQAAEATTWRRKRTSLTMKRAKVGLMKRAM